MGRLGRRRSMSLHGGLEALQPMMESGTYGSTSPAASSSGRKQANRDRKEAKKRKWQSEREELHRLRESRGDAGGDRGQRSKGGGKKGKSSKSSESICFSWNGEMDHCHRVQSASTPPSGRTDAHRAGRRVTLRSNAPARSRCSGLRDGGDQGDEGKAGDQGEKDPKEEGGDEEKTKRDIRRSTTTYMPGSSGSYITLQAREIPSEVRSIA